MRLACVRHVAVSSAVCAAVILSSCQPASLSPATAKILASWFVTPRPDLRQTLNKEKLSPRQWDSLFQSIHSSPPAIGRFSPTITDPQGKPYTLGYATPATVRADTVYPLIIYLHGGTGGVDATKGSLAYAMLLPLADSMNLFLASPSANREVPWWSPGGIERILQTLRYMTARYPIDPERVFLAGVSDGAAGCYAAANTAWAPFAGFIAISGSGLYLERMGLPLVPRNLMHRPVHTIYAGLDHIFPAVETRQFISQLTEAGVPITTSLHPDEKHGFDYREGEYGNIANLVRTWRRPATRAVSGTLTQGFRLRADGLVDYVEEPDAKSSVSILAHWRGDTLLVESAGLRSVTIAGSGRTGQTYVRVNKGTTRRIRSASLTSRRVLSYVMSTGFPSVPDSLTLYEVSTVPK